MGRCGDHCLCGFGVCLSAGHSAGAGWLGGLGGADVLDCSSMKRDWILANPE